MAKKKKTKDDPKAVELNEKDLDSVVGGVDSVQAFQALSSSSGTTSQPKTKIMVGYKGSF